MVSVSVSKYRRSQKYRYRVSIYRYYRSILSICIAVPAYNKYDKIRPHSIRSLQFDPYNTIKTFDLCPFVQKISTLLQPPMSESVSQLRLGGCKWVEFFWSKGQRSNLLIELQGSNGKRSNLIEAFGSKTFFVCLKSIDYHNVGHMLCMRARSQRHKDQLPQRSFRGLRSR